MTRYNIDQLKQNINLIDFASRFTTLRPKTTKEHTGPCPACGGDDRFCVQADKWLCRKCTDGRWRDVIDLAGLVLGIESKGTGFEEICQWLGAQEVKAPLPNTRLSNRPARTTVDINPPPQDWQNQALNVVTYGASRLWADAGTKARQWLNQRGLNDETLKGFQVGFNPTNQKINGLWVYGGIIIPHIANRILWGIKIRLSQEGRRQWLIDWQRDHPGKHPPPSPPKYMMVKGSRLSLFNADALEGQEYTFVVEGEFDAMLAYQEFGDLAPSVTLGGAPSKLGAYWLESLLSIRRFYIATDNDGPGQRARSYWQRLVGQRGQLAQVPTGKDITDYYRAGGDLRLWAGQHLASVSLLDFAVMLGGRLPI